MLPRITTRGRALRQASHAVQNQRNSKSPFTNLRTTSASAKSVRHTKTGGARIDQFRCPRAEMSSTSAGASRVSATETFLDYTSSPDIDFDRIEKSMTCAKFRDSVWGFVVERATHCALLWGIVLTHDV
jgi:hypothetical protein